ncbi:MAG: AbrB family transcriptional regulator, partial [Pseudomonadota bacterium]
MPTISVNRQEYRATIYTLTIGATGGILAYALSLPAAFLVGPAFIVTLAGFCKIPLHVPIFLRNICFLIIGLELGTGITVEAIRQATTWPLSLGMILVLLLAIMLCGGMMCARLCNFSRHGGIMAATPGHLSFVLSLAIDRDMD